MPSYSYQCQTCGNTTLVRRPMVDRNLPASCDCGGTAERIFNAQFQIVAAPFFLDDANKFMGGFDETSRRETAKADEKLRAERDARIVDMPTVRMPKLDLKAEFCKTRPLQG